MTAHFRPFCWPFGGISLSPACGQGRALFLYTKFCVQDRGAGKTTPCGLCAGIRPNRRQRRRSERRKARARPHALTLEDRTPHHCRNLPARRRGRRAPQGADGAHGAASGARTAGGREADRRDSGDGRARAPRATDFGQRPKDAGGCAPAPAKISAWGRPPEGGEPDEGKGGAPRGRGGGRGTTRRETERPALPHATASAAAIGQASARRQAAGAPEGRKGHAPARHADA